MGVSASRRPLSCAWSRQKARVSTLRASIVNACGLPAADARPRPGTEASPQFPFIPAPIRHLTPSLAPVSKAPAASCRSGTPQAGAPCLSACQGQARALIGCQVSGDEGEIEWGNVWRARQVASFTVRGAAPSPQVSKMMGQGKKPINGFFFSFSGYNEVIGLGKYGLCRP